MYFSRNLAKQCLMTSSLPSRAMITCNRPSAKIALTVGRTLQPPPLRWNVRRHVPAALKSTLAWGNLLLEPDERAPPPKPTPIEAATAKQLIQNQLAARNPENPVPATPVPVAKPDPAVLPKGAGALADTSINEPTLLPSSAAIENNLQILEAEANADLMTSGEGEDQDNISATKPENPAILNPSRGPAS